MAARGAGIRRRKSPASGYWGSAAPRPGLPDSSRCAPGRPRRTRATCSIRSRSLELDDDGLAFDVTEAPDVSGPKSRSGGMACIDSCFHGRVLPLARHFDQARFDLLVVGEAREANALACIALKILCWVHGFEPLLILGVIDAYATQPVMEKMHCDAAVAALLHMGGVSSHESGCVLIRTHNTR